MEEHAKKALYQVSTLFLAVLTVVTVFVGFSYFQASSLDRSERTFQVTGEGEVTSIPDVAEFTFSVLTEGGLDLGSLQDSNSERTGQVIDVLRTEGQIASEDITTRSYVISPRYQWNTCPSEGREPCPPPDIVGYSIRNTVHVKVRDLEKTGTLLSSAIQAGANEVTQIIFTIDDPDALMKEARDLAFADAEQKAQEFAEAGGFEVGRIVSISESSSAPRAIFRDTAQEESGVGGASPVPVEPGSQDISALITIVYEIR